MKKLLSILTAAVLTLGAGAALADAKNKVVIQVSSADEVTQKIALNNANNLKKGLGDDVDVEIVAYGPGLSLLTVGGKQSERVPNLAMQGIAFSACGNTMKGITKKTGKTPELVEGVKVVPGGVMRIMQLQQQGYAYIRP
ncbi:MAG: DsrE family protein [Gammaproteobacteria bacterium]|jgi:hypothetical protein|nr:DsrE family protein [Gammaproteobacteria bacterium]